MTNEHYLGLGGQDLGLRSRFGAKGKIRSKLGIRDSIQVSARKGINVKASTGNQETN